MIDMIFIHSILMLPCVLMLRLRLIEVISITHPRLRVCITMIPTSWINPMMWSVSSYMIPACRVVRLLVVTLLLVLLVIVM